MDIFKSRFASARDIIVVFALCIGVVYSWSILMFLRNLPAWLLYLNPWDIVGILAYSQVFAFVESLLVLFTVIFLGAVLPNRLLRERFVAHGTVLVLLAGAFAVVAQYTREIPWWPSKRFLLAMGLYLASFGLSCWLIGKYERLEKFINAFSGRLTVFLYIYPPVAFLSGVVVILRNI